MTRRLCIRLPGRWTMAPLLAVMTALVTASCAGRGVPETLEPGVAAAAI
jgi:hypothetical protein